MKDLRKELEEFYSYIEEWPYLVADEMAFDILLDFKKEIMEKIK